MDEDEKELDLALYEEALEQEQRELEVSTMRRHRLKTLETYFNLSRQGVKPYEIRENDRLYQRGDIIELYNINKNFSGIPQIRTMAGTWAPWPLDSFTKQPLSLDMFETDFLHSLECITCRISFVLPGNEKIGLFDDYVILSLEVESYRGSDWPSGRMPDLFTTANVYNTANQIKPETTIPAGVYFVRELEGFFDEVDGVGKGNWFNETYRYERHRFAIKSLKDHNAIVETRKQLGRQKIMERYKENTTGVPAGPAEIPYGVYYDREEGDFFDMQSGFPMNAEFNQKWANRAFEFPSSSPIVTHVFPDPKASPSNPETEAKEPVADIRAIPGNVYWSPENDNFYNADTNKGMGNEFYKEWKDRYLEFPTEILNKSKLDAKGKPKA